MTETSSTTVSVIIPIPPDGDANVALGSLPELAFPAGQCEVLVVEGRQPSRQRNEAARSAGGDLLYFLDNDSRVHPDTFARAVEHLEDEDVVGVGGPNLPAPPVNLTERAVGIVLQSAAGTSVVRTKYSSRGQARRAREFDVILCNMCLRRGTFLEHGGFDERLYPNEETEFFHRLLVREPERHILYDPAVVVDRRRPRGLFEFVAKIFTYGRGRMEQTLLAPSATTLVHLLPMAFVVWGIVSAAVGLWWMGASWLAYAAGVVAMATFQAARQGPLVTWPLLAVCYPATHISYGLGQIWGLVRFPVASLRRRARPVEVWRVKPLGAPWPDDGLGDRRRWRLAAES